MSLIQLKAASEFRQKLRIVFRVAALLGCILVSATPIQQGIGVRYAAAKTNQHSKRLVLPNIPAPQEVTAPLWEQISAMAEGRYAFTATVLNNGKVLVVGGYTTNGVSLQTAEIYDPENNIWTSAGALSNPRAEHRATLLKNGKVLITGGIRNDGISKYALNSAELYDPASGVWTLTNPMSTARANHTATLLDNKNVLIFGGYNDDGVLNTTEVYAQGQWISLSSIGPAVQGHTATLLTNGNVLITGGYNNGGTSNQATVFITNQGIWLSIKPLRTGRSNHTATLLRDGSVLIAGGYPFFESDPNPPNPTPSAERFYPNTEGWADTGAPSIARVGATATLLPDGKVLIAGGEVNISGTKYFLNSAEIYDPETNTWSPSKSMYNVRSLPTMVSLPDSTVLIMGGATGSTSLNTAEQIGPFKPKPGNSCVATALFILENSQCSLPIHFSRFITNTNSFTITAHSNNKELIPDANITMEGSGIDRTMTIKPAITNANFTPTRQGDAVITIEARYKRQTETLQYQVTVIPPPWLVMLYLNGDDGPLDPFGTLRIDSITPAIKSARFNLLRMPFNPSMRLVILTDFHENNSDSNIYVRDPNSLTNVTLKLINDQSAWPGFTSELDSADPLNVRAFVNWSQKTYPGSTYSFLSLVDHGGGWAPDFDDVAGQPRNIRIWQAGGWRGMSIDYTSGGDSMSTQDTHEALQGLGINVVFFDACLMAMLESAYEIRNDADYLIAGQSQLYADLPYHNYLSTENLRPSTDPRSLALSITGRYNQDISSIGNPFTIGTIDLHRLRSGTELTNLVNTLAQTIIRELPASGPIPDTNPLVIALKEAYNRAQKFDYDSNEEINQTDGYVDLGDFAQELSANKYAPESVMKAARQVVAATVGSNSPVIKTISTTGFRIGRPMNFFRSTGLSIYLPLGEQDYRPTLVDTSNPLCPAKPERQLTYYANPTQLAFTRDYPQWSRLLERLEQNVPIRRAPVPTGCAGPPAVQAAGEPVIDTRPFNSPMPLMPIRQTVYVPTVTH